MLTRRSRRACRPYTCNNFDKYRSVQGSGSPPIPNGTPGAGNSITCDLTERIQGCSSSVQGCHKPSAPHKIVGLKERITGGSTRVPLEAGSFKNTSVGQCAIHSISRRASIRSSNNMTPGEPPRTLKKSSPKSKPALHVRCSTEARWFLGLQERGSLSTFFLIYPFILKCDA